MSLHQFALGAAPVEEIDKPLTSKDWNKADPDSAAVAAAKRRKLNSPVSSLNGLGTASVDTSANTTMETSDGDGSDSDPDEELLVADWWFSTTKDNDLDFYDDDSSDSSEGGGTCDTSLKSFLLLKTNLNSRHSHHLSSSLLLLQQRQLSPLSYPGSVRRRESHRR